MARILSLDILRGISIFLMTIVHTLTNVYNMDNLKNLDVFNLNPILIVLGGFLFALGHSKSFFLMLSAIIHTFLTYSKINDGQKIETVVRRDVFYGFLIYLMGLIREGLFNPFGIFTEYWLTGVWDINELRTIYFFETLQMIGIGLILLSLTIYVVIILQNKIRLSKRVTMFLHMGIYAILAIIFTFSAPLVHNLTNLHLGLSSELEYKYVTGGIDDYLARFFWVSLSGNAEPIFPFMATVYVGAIIGFQLSREKITRKFPIYLTSFGIFLIIFGLWYWLFIEKLTGKLWFNIPPTWFFIVNTGLHLLYIALFLKIIEFNPKLNKEKIKKRSLFLRRWSKLSLTIYMFQIIDAIPREILTRILDIDFISRSQLELGWTLFLIVIVILFWEIIIRSWEKLGFIFTWEWILLRVRGIILNQNEKPKCGLNIQNTLYGFEIIQFVDPIRNKD